jgi:dihydrofolate reductase
MFANGKVVKMVSLIVAETQNRVIGQGNRIPWRLTRDLARLKRLTKDQVVILGRKTYDSMDGYYTASGRELPGRKYLVVTRDQNFKPERPNAQAVYSLEQALEFAENLQAGEVFVLGGASMYEGALPLADRIYMTRVMEDIEGDTFFPELKESEWRIVEREVHAADERNEYPFEFLVYERA